MKCELRTEHPVRGRVEPPRTAPSVEGGFRPSFVSPPPSMTPLRHPVLRRVLAGLLLSGFASWLLPPTVRASVLTASAPEPWLRHGMAGADGLEDAPLDDHQRHRLVQTVAGVLSLQGALISSAGSVLSAAPKHDKPRSGAVHTHRPRPALLHRSDTPQCTIAPAGPAVLLRSLTSARPLGP